MSEDNRARMLALAVAAIDEGGEESIRVNHLVAQAGLAPPALYHHFGSREGLVIAAQVERYRKRLLQDIAMFESAVAASSSAHEFERVVVQMWTMVLAERRSSRWVRINAVGSAFARPELERAIAAANDELIAEIVRVLVPHQRKGWLRTDLDLTSAIAWQHAVLLSRAFIEHGETMVEPAEWDRFTLDAFVRLFFGHPIDG